MGVVQSAGPCCEVHGAIRSHLEELASFWEQVARPLVLHFGSRVDADMMNLRLAFYEAMTNIIKHAHQEDGRLIPFEMRLGENQVELSIHDTGPGFQWPAQDASFDFEDESGRGLFLMRSLMTEARYIPEKNGNRTYLCKHLPPEKKTEEAHFPASIRPRALHTSRRVLVVDDDDMVRYMLSHIVGNLGCEVTLAESGREALRLFRAAPPFDAALVDVMMPEIDGLEVARTIRREQEAYYTPIILLTSKDKAEDVAAGLDSGADEYITKPPRKTELSARLRAAFRVHDMAKELRSMASEMKNQSDQLKSQLREAQSIQCAMLPPASFNVGSYRCCSVFRPSHYVGGDMFNAFRVDESTYGFYLADVSGHGVPAALLSMWLNRTLQPQRAPGAIVTESCEESPGYRVFAPSAICQTLDDLLVSEECSKYLTMLYVEANESEGMLRYCNAGHPPAIIRRDPGVWDQLPVGGAPIGMGLGLGFDNGTSKLGYGERMFLYSDGVIECFSDQREPFGEARLMHTLDDCAALSMEAQLQKVIDALHAHAGTSTFEDDVTILGVERRR